MKPSPTSPPAPDAPSSGGTDIPVCDEPKARGSLPPLLAFGAHPDDIEFGVGAVIASETRAGRPAHFAICSRGESASNGTPDQRTAEATQAATLLGATLEFLDLGGDAHFQITPAHTLQLAAVIRRLRPSILLAPTTVPNQHPDHPRLGHMVRDAARLARYAGLHQLRPLPPHAIDALLFYAITPDAEPHDICPILYDISDPQILSTWTAAMQAHASQLQTRNYVDLQLSRARTHGLRAGTSHAIPLYPNDPPIITSLAQLGRAARRF